MAPAGINKNEMCSCWSGSAGEAVCRGGERGRVKLPEFEDFAREHSVKNSARRSECGSGYGLPPLPPFSGFVCIGCCVCVFEVMRL